MYLSLSPLKIIVIPQSWVDIGNMQGLDNETQYPQNLTEAFQEEKKGFRHLSSSVFL